MVLSCFKHGLVLGGERSLSLTLITIGEHTKMAPSKKFAVLASTKSMPTKKRLSPKALAGREESPNQSAILILSELSPPAGMN
jgi:hypothetical protein